MRAGAFSAACCAKEQAGTWWPRSGILRRVLERIRQTVRGLRESVAWHRAHRAPREGEPAPDFELRDAKGENPVRLSSFRGKTPVALVFGSFT